MPERLMHIYQGECSLHVAALAEARKWLSFAADSVQRITNKFESTPFSPKIKPTPR